MKKLFAFTALAAACGASIAQDAHTVTLYGIADGGVSHVTGLRGGSRTNLVSGIMEGTRFGFRGNEDLGGGYRAIFTLENRAELDNGTVTNRPPSGSQLPDRLSSAALLGLNPAAAFQPLVSGVANSIGNTVGVNLRGGFFDRQAYVGLITPFGAFLAGRQYTPAYEVAGTFDTLGTQSSLAWGQVASLPASIDIRQDDALQYRIQLGGFTAGLMVTFPGSAVKDSANRLIGLQAVYKSEPFSVGLGYNARNDDLGEKSLKSIVVGASAKLGPGTLSAGYATVKDDHPTGTSAIDDLLIAQGVPAVSAALVQTAFINALKQDLHTYHVGYKLVTGPHTIYAAYSVANDKRAANADTASYGAAYSYALSKRTDLNLVLTHFNNKNLAQAAPGQAGFLGGVTDTAGTDSNNFAVGVRHRF